VVKERGIRDREVEGGGKWDEEGKGRKWSPIAPLAQGPTLASVP